jgi:flavin prenyltransferase
MKRPRIIVGITGASGTIYGRTLLDELTQLDVEIHLIVSPASLILMREELGVTFAGNRFNVAKFLGRRLAKDRVIMHSDGDLAAPPASGTFRAQGMVICPCSMKTLGTLATGTGASLICRAAEACLKERRRVVLVPRESPLSLIHLRNMVTLTEVGAIVLPAAPGFYHHPKTIDDLVRHVVLKTLDALGVEHSIPFRWKDPE